MAIEANEKLFKSNRELHEKIDGMREDMNIQTDMLNNISTQLDIATDERAPRTESADSHFVFALLNLNTRRADRTHYAVRVQRRSLQPTINRIKTTYPRLEICVQIDQPNAVNLYNLIKQELQDQRGVITCTGNYITIGEDYSSRRLIRAVRRIDAAKKAVDV